MRMPLQLNGLNFHVEHALEIDYTNWRGERAKRMIVPKFISLKPAIALIEFIETPHHKPAVWCYRAWDIAKAAERTYALCQIHATRVPGEDEIWDLIYAAMPQIVPKPKPTEPGVPT